ncbi:hypothetical protein RR48_11015 [Papilio machaon]|uniref:Uncharacterized protein n=1 Tax=Papilio machaon TaxID=76193 RepID=A0A194RNG5_PAPMA|nr:hypothetical protein RR48_11015 [Papilio machaon]
MLQNSYVCTNGLLWITMDTDSVDALLFVVPSHETQTPAAAPT